MGVFKRLLVGIVIFSSIFSISILSAEQAIQIKGSDTMVNLGQAWAETYMEQNPSVSIAVTGGGSGTGITALINGTCDIAESSREMSEKEHQLAKSKGLNVQEISVGIDAIAFIVHPENPVSQLSIDQISGIFTGKIKNWKEVGGKDQSILMLSRERNSGTHVYVLEEIVRKGVKGGTEEFAPSVLMMSSSQAIEQEVADNKTAIGYFGLGYVSPKIKSLNILDPRTGQYVAPNTENALEGVYPVSRPLLFYLPGEPEGALKEFIDFVLSEKGQNVVLDMHFVPLKKSSS